MESNKLLMIIICVLLPPVGVFIKFGLGTTFLINLVLTLFFFVPGMVHALWLVLK
ncbi:YqaE/Pmp3 family membrane protein [Vibrio astriarenae]|uniref:YqaE/Pmp3 family membrane protein n=1 Tax=Vibrio astriarenae TaxID=1481923 RepID=UPI003736CB98